MSEHPVEVADRQRRDATVAGNVDVVGTFIADDCVYVHSSGAVETKEVLLGRLASGDLRYHSIVAITHSLRDYGNFALVNGDLALDITSAGTARKFTIRYLAVWVNRADAWQLLSWQSVTLP